MLVVYAFLMHVNVYMLLCMNFHGHGYACIAGNRCIVIVIFMVLCHRDPTGKLWCWCVGWDEARDVDYQREVATLDLKVRVDHHIGLYVWHVGIQLMVVIRIMVTYILVILLLLWSHVW